VLRLKSVTRPVDPYDLPKDKSKGKQKEEAKGQPPAPASTSTESESATKEANEEVKEEDSVDDLPEELRFKPLPQWTAATTRSLRPVFSDSSIKALYALLVEGKEPPPKVDAGWGTRKARVEVAAVNEETAMNVSEEAAANASAPAVSSRGRGQGRDRGRGRGGRGGRGGGRGGESEQWTANKDDREVLSQVNSSSVGKRFG
jgi:tRNA pseudouridine13 synthase